MESIAGERLAGAHEILAASEIAEYVFCPRAWYLRRHAAPRSAEADRRLQAGTLAHRRIGRATDRVRRVDAARRALLMAIALAVLLLLVQLGGLSRLAPW
ncbi:MAG TPA: PD-(D/E)XK nuclease family protein [Chloroflexota bacterium]|jgi:CRISPR/Cas system-associated exonuclease Cas4 (RecB family)